MIDPTSQLRNSRTRTMVIAALLASVMLAPRGVTEPSLAAASEVAGSGSVYVVHTREAQPYRDAEAAMGRELGALLKRESALIGDGGGLLKKAVAGDVVVALGTEAAQRAASGVASGVQVVCAMVAEPEAAGLSGKAHVSGVSTEVPAKAQVELIGRVMPGVSRVGVLVRAKSERGGRAVAAFRAAAPAWWSVETVTLEEGAAAADAIAKLVDAGPDLIWTYTDSTLFDVGTIKALLLASLRKKVPVFGFSPAFVRSGAMFGVSIDAAAQGRQAADLVRDAMNGIPRRGFEPPRFGVAINTVVADRLGITIPPGILAEAEVVFKGE